MPSRDRHTDDADLGARGRMPFTPVIAAALALLAAACAGGPRAAVDDRPGEMLNPTPAAEAPLPIPTREQLDLLSLLGGEWIRAEDEGAAPSGGALSAYRIYFGFGSGLSARGIDGPTGRIFLARLAARGERKGVALLIHGYRAHGGHFASFAELVADSGWDCYLVDLPGHGLSEGDRFGIGDFSDYGRATLAAVAAIRELEEGGTGGAAARPGEGRPPFVLIGHSTGCSAIIEAFRVSAAEGGVQPADGVVFAAPLVDMPNKRLRGALNAVAGDRLLELPGFASSPALIGPGVTCNPAYREFIANGDPLSDWVYHTSWLNSYLDWYDGLAESPPLIFEGPTLVVQGTGDTVVNWRESQELLDRMFPARETLFYEGYSHTILNAAPERLAQIFGDIAAFVYDLPVR